MRLIDIKRSINIAKENFEYSYSTTSNNNYISKIQNLKIVFSELVKCGLLEPGNEFIQAALSSNSDSLSMNSTLYSSRLEFLKDVQFLLDNLHIWINNYVPYDQDEDTTINIKLPNIPTLKSFAETSVKLEKSLSYISYVYGGESVKVQQLDHGSLWVIISVCGVQIVKALGKAISFAYDIAEKHINLQKMKEELRKARIENDAIENLSKIQEQAINNLLNDAARELNQELSPEELDNERIEKLELSIRQLTDLIISGMEFHPALTASAEIIQDFPTNYSIEASEVSGLLSNQRETSNENE